MVTSIRGRHGGSMNGVRSNVSRARFFQHHTTILAKDSKNISINSYTVVFHSLYRTYGVSAGFFSKNERRATFYERRSVCRYQRHFITYSLYFIWSVYYERFCERQSWVFSSGMLLSLLL